MVHRDQSARSAIEQVKVMTTDYRAKEMKQVRVWFAAW